MSPGVERAIAGAQVWAKRLGSSTLLLNHLVLALLDEEEGRPAVLLERAGQDVPVVRGLLQTLIEVPAAPMNDVLFNVARAWSISHRHDPEFLTDAFLLAVLRAAPAFQRTVAGIGLDSDSLEALLLGDQPHHTELQTEAVAASFTMPDTTTDADAGRILDASFNRAREATRVLEDYCRFNLDDRFLTEQLKGVRHSLAAIAAQLPAGLLLASRDTLHDVGTEITARGEYERQSPVDVATANLKRLQESLRSLEEFGKLFVPDLARDLESLRYRSYTLERAVVSGGQSRGRLARARLYVLLSGAQCVASLDWTIAQVAAGGAEIIQLREKSLQDRELLARARDVRRWTRQAGVLFIVNDRPDIARLVDADGVHLGQDDMLVKDARRIIGPDKLIGVSTHSIEQVRHAVLEGADYLGVGPVFPSPTKAFDHFPGLDFVRSAAAETSLPAFVLGGIGLANLGEVVAAGARRIAVGSAIAATDDPERSARLLRAGLE